MLQVKKKHGRMILLTSALAFLLFATYETQLSAHAQAPNPSPVYITMPMGTPKYGCIGRPIAGMFGVGYKSGDDLLMPLVEGTASVAATRGTLAPQKWTWSPATSPNYFDFIYTPDTKGKAQWTYTADLAGTTRTRTSEPFPILNCTYHVSFTAERSSVLRAGSGTLSSQTVTVKGEGDFDIRGIGMQKLEVQGYGTGTAQGGINLSMDTQAMKCTPVSPGEGSADFTIEGTYNAETEFLKININLSELIITGEQHTCITKDGPQTVTQTIPFQAGSRNFQEIKLVLIEDKGTDVNSEPPFDPPPAGARITEIVTITVEKRVK
jgi:hypothetical protein